MALVPVSRCQSVVISTCCSAAIAVSVETMTDLKSPSACSILGKGSEIPGHFAESRRQHRVPHRLYLACLESGRISCVRIALSLVALWGSSSIKVSQQFETLGQMLRRTDR